MRIVRFRCPRAGLWFGRGLIGLVLAWNVQAAIAFLIAPGAFAPGFELTVPVGSAIVRGMGVLFLMWNVPYAVALWHPVRHRLSLYEAVVMQAIGLLGETFILWSLGSGHSAAVTTVSRFIAFDGIGLLVLFLAVGVTREIAKPITAGIRSRRSSSD